MTRRDKIAVTVPHELVLAAVREGRAGSVSAYVAESMERRARADELDSLLDEMLELTGGPMTDPDREEIDGLAGW